MKKLLLIALLMLTVVFVAVACTEPTEPADTTAAETTVGETDGVTDAVTDDETDAVTDGETDAVTDGETDAVTDAENDAETTAQSGPVVEPTETVAVPDYAVNVAVGASVYAASEYIEDGLFNPTYLVDGVRGGDSKWGWSSSVEMAPPSDFSIMLVLSDVYKLYGITLVPVKMCAGEGFPSAYEVAVSSDGVNWTTVVTASGIDAKAETPDAVEPLVHGFAEAIDALYVNITIKEFSATQNDIEVARIGDIELAGTFPNAGSETVEVPDNATNVALNGTVTATNYWCIHGNNFYPWLLNDGNWPEGTESNSWYCIPGTAAGELYATIDLNGVYTLYQIVLGRPCWGAFPEAYRLQVSLDGETWTTVVFATGMTDEGSANGVVHGLTAAVDARYVRVQILAHAPSDDPTSGIGEFEVYGVYLRDPGVVIPEDATNVALGATVTAPTSEINTGTWAPQNLVDGIWDTITDTNDILGWTSPVLEMPPEDLRVVIELEEMCTLYRVTLYPMQWDKGTGFPRGYELLVSEDGVNWTTVASASGVDASAASDTDVKPVVHYLDEAVKAKYFALRITEHSFRRWGDNAVPHSALGEIELTGTPVAE